MEGETVFSKLLIPIIAVLVPCSAFSFSIGDFGEAVKQIKKVQEQAKEIERAVKERPISGEIVIDDVSKPWFFKMEWFDAAACSRIYYQVNGGKPIFLVEFVGPRPPVGAPIPIEGLKKGDRVRFLVKTHWDGRWMGPVSSQDPRFFKAFKKGKHLYYFQFEDAAAADRAYNDGAFTFYQEGEGPTPNKNLRILSYEAFRQGSGFLLTGKVKVNTPGYVKSEIEIRDNHWNVERLIENGFKAEKPGTYAFKRLVQLSPAPFHTSFWRVSLNGEADSRIRGLGDCTPLAREGEIPQAERKLLIYYPFDDCTAKDASGNGYDGTVVGAPPCVGGVKGKALYFNASDRDNGCGKAGGDYIAVPKIGRVWSRGITICSWVKFEDNRWYEKIVDLGKTIGEKGGYNIVFGRLENSNRIDLESWVNSNGEHNRTAGRLTYPGIVNGKWQFYCATIDNRTGKMRIYINGQLKAEKIGNSVANVERESNFIGHSNWCFNDPDFKGAIDELRIYNYSLPPEKIKEIYRKEAPGNTPEGSSFGSAKENPFVFEGTIYAIPPGTDRLPNFSKLKPIGRIYSAVLNITPRDFSTGFPGVSNRFEWFAIDYRGKIFIPETRTYTFSLLSDDGAKLIIDGKTVIDNDGIHPPTKKTGSVKLTKGFHTVEVQYFQGPRYQVALVLSLVKNGREVPFDIREFAPAKIEESQYETKITMGSGILFDFNSYQLKPEAMKLLDTVYGLLSGMEYRKVVVEGHTDNVGSEKYNLKLSKERAQSVANYLIAKGIPKEKITVIGYGETKPLYPNDTPEHRAKNRRVEIKVLKKCDREK